MDTDTHTASALPKRRLTALLLSTLVATSFLMATPSTQTPAYGLVEAGFVDGVALGGLRMWRKVLVDPLTGRAVLGNEMVETVLDPQSRRAYTIDMCSDTPPHYRAGLYAQDLDTQSELWSKAVECGMIPVIPRGRSEIWGVDSWVVRKYDAANGALISEKTFQTNTGFYPLVIGDGYSRKAYLIQKDLFDKWRYPPPPQPRLIEKVDLEAVTVTATGSATLADACGAAINPATNMLYIVDEQPGRVVAVDLRTLREVASLDVAPYIGTMHRIPFGCRIAINPQLNRIYLIRMEPQLDFSRYDYDEQRKGGTAYLVSIDAETMTVREEVEIANTTSEQSLAVDPRTSKVYVYAPTEENQNRVQVFSDSSPETLIGDLQTGRYTQWFFAEGTTRPGYRMWLTLFSPDQPNKVRISYLTGPGQPGPFFQEVELPANTRITINVNDQIGEGLDVSTRIVSVWGKPFYAERPMYFRGGEATSDGGTLGAGQHN